MSNAVELPKLEIITLDVAQKIITAAIAKARELSRTPADDADAPHEIRAIPTRHP